MAKPAVLKGKDIVVFVRKLSEAKEKVREDFIDFALAIGVEL